MLICLFIYEKRAVTEQYFFWSKKEQLIEFNVFTRLEDTQDYYALLLGARHFEYLNVVSKHTHTHRQKN